MDQLALHTKALSHNINHLICLAVADHIFAYAIHGAGFYAIVHMKHLFIST